MLTVIKIGGSLLKDDAALPEVARSLAALAGSYVVVHGGGPEITHWQERLGLQVEWKDGLRVTTPASVQVATMVLSGWVNKRIVAAMVGAGLLAVGISGEDGALLFRDSGGGVLPAVPAAPEAPDEAVDCLRDAQAETGVTVDALTSAGTWDGLFPPDYDRIVEVAGGWG